MARFAFLHGPTTGGKSATAATVQANTAFIAAAKKALSAPGRGGVTVQGIPMTRGEARKEIKRMGKKAAGATKALAAMKTRGAKTRGAR